MPDKCEDFDAQAEYDEIRPLLDEIEDRCKAAGIPFFAAFGICSNSERSGVVACGHQVDRRDFPRIRVCMDLVGYGREAVRVYEPGEDNLAKIALEIPVTAQGAPQNPSEFH